MCGKLSHSGSSLSLSIENERPGGGAGTCYTGTGAQYLPVSCAGSKPGVIVTKFAIFTHRSDHVFDNCRIFIIKWLYFLLKEPHPAENLRVPVSVEVHAEDVNDPDRIDVV